MDEVTVDRKTLRALGADSRIAILKNLARKRMTQAELADMLGMAAPSVNEHLRQLQSASLIAQIDDGRKWKYYEITPKGKAIVQPTNVKVWFLLSISLLALVASMWQIYPSISQPIPQEMLIREVTMPFAPLDGATDANGVAETSAPFIQSQSITSGSSIAPANDSSQNITSEENNLDANVAGSSINAGRPIVNESVQITGYKSLLTSLPAAETAILLVSILLLGASVALLLKKE